MIFSAQQELSDDQAVTVTAISENVIDLGAAGIPYGAAAAIAADIGKGVPVPLLCQVTADFATLTSLTITLETSAAAALTSSTVIATESILLADLVAGKTLNMQFIPNGATGQYLGFRYTVVGTTATAGAITAGVTMGNQTNS